MQITTFVVSQFNGNAIATATNELKSSSFALAILCT